MFPNNNLESEFTFETNADPLPDEAPFHVLLLGDWSGSTRPPDSSRRRPVVIDRDNFEEVFAKLDVKVDLDWQGDSLSIEFDEFDDFHPDNLFRKVSLFSDLRDLRRRLSNPDSFESAAREVRSWFNVNDHEQNDAAIQNDIDDTPPIESDNLLDAIISHSSPPPSETRSQTVDRSELGRFISKIVAPHLITINESEQSKLIAAVDNAVSDLMRSILHHPQFQALESAWRGLYFLVRRIETDSDLKIFILNLSKEELAEDLRGVTNLSDSILYRQVVFDGGAGNADHEFAVIGGNYNFGVNVEDIASLMRISQIAAASNAPFLSYIQPDIYGIESFSDLPESFSLRPQRDAAAVKLWSALREAAEAVYLGLSPMKVLARMPYGRDTEKIDMFDFEEFDGIYRRRDFLWMNPCFASVYLLAKSFRLSGWEMRNNLQTTIDKLPLFIFHDGEETHFLPCSEVVLTETMFETLLEQGLMPLVAARNSDILRLPGFLSVSARNQSLAGKW